VNERAQLGSGAADGRPATVVASIAVIVVNYGSTELIRGNLDVPRDLAGIRVVIVDNFSDAAERARISKLCAERGWTPVLLDSNAGFSAGVNAGMAAAAGHSTDAYLVLNPDASIDVATVDALHQHVTEHPMELVSPLITNPDGSTWSDGHAVQLQNGRMRRRPGLADIGPDEEPWIAGTCIALSEQLRAAIDGMPNGYFLYWEDVDLSVRVRRSGGQLRIREDLVATHDQGRTQRDADGPKLSNIYYYYNCRNRLVFGSRFLSRRRQLNWILSTPRQSWLILLRGGGKRELIRRPRALLAGLTGSVAGLMIMTRSLLRADADTRR